jgi:hypothetical protein
MPWTSVKPASQFGPVPEPEPRLRLYTRRNGWLNASAQEFLFEGQRGGQVDWQEYDNGSLSLVANPAGAWKVNRRGNLSVTPVTSRSNGGELPVTLRLRPDTREGRRLVVAGMVT